MIPANHTKQYIKNISVSVLYLTNIIYMFQFREEKELHQNERLETCKWKYLKLLCVSSCMFPCMCAVYRFVCTRRHRYKCVLWGGACEGQR